MLCTSNSSDLSGFLKQKQNITKRWEHLVLGEIGYTTNNFVISCFNKCKFLFNTFQHLGLKLVDNFTFAMVSFLWC